MFEFEVNCLEPVQNIKAEVKNNDVVLTWETSRTLLGYQIYRDNEMIGETEGLRFTDENVSAGEYEYAVSVKYNGGNSEYVTINVKVEGDDVNEFSNVKFSIYPNPAKDVINIISTAKSYEFQLMNNIGQIVMHGCLSGENTISVENIDNGIYFLKLIADGEVSINKIIIQ